MNIRHKKEKRIHFHTNKPQWLVASV